MQNWDEPYYPLAIFNSSVAKWVSGVAWHCYGGDVTAQSSVQAAYPSMSTYLTECSDGTWVPNPWDSTMQLLLGALNNYAKGVIRWGIALDPNNEPHLPGGCDTCTGIVTINNETSWVPNADYWVRLCSLSPAHSAQGFAHFAPYLPRGSVRIASTTTSPLMSTAFLTPASNVVVVVYNTGQSATSVALSWHGSSVSVSLPGMSAATFTWPA